MSELDRGGGGARGAADARAAAETALAEADRAARRRSKRWARRAKRAPPPKRASKRARERRDELLQTIESELNVAPADLAALAGLPAGERRRPRRRRVERKLESLKQERERLGAVNLRADEELAEVTASRDRAGRRARRPHRGDQAAAPGDPAASTRRGANGCSPPSTSSTSISASCSRTLFEGGTAELQLIESDDPLEAGLELVARPPGKKPQTLTLLSGGEQALTAMALIFAVFLTNPSPICVLDEVDAPLDDFNVERFCDLLDEMRRRSDTRFVTITHNPITMARMDRLFGVTMAERGVSQIVSVDLAEAERLAEAG